MPVFETPDFLVVAHYCVHQLGVCSICLGPHLHSSNEQLAKMYIKLRCTLSRLINLRDIQPFEVAIYNFF